MACPEPIRLRCMRRNSGEFGVTPEELAVLLEPFIGGGTKDNLFLSKTGDQAVAATPFTLTWEVVTGNIPIASNQISLEAGKTYEGLLVCRGLFTAAGFISFGFHDVTNGQDFTGAVLNGHGIFSFGRPQSDGSNLSSVSVGSAIMTPTTDILIDARINAESNLSNVNRIATWGSVKEL